MVKLPHWPNPINKIPTDITFNKINVILEGTDFDKNNLPKIIHVAGTDGKGSTIAFLNQILISAGYKVHTYTSPHLNRFNERIKLNNNEINDNFLYEVIEACRLSAEKNKIEVNFFEGTTAAAFLAFSKIPADFLIIETGVGGKFDPTNFLSKKSLTIITSISLDHTNILGNNLTNIALHKAGILRSNTPCIISAQPEEVSLTLNQQCDYLNIPVFEFEYDFIVEKFEDKLKFFMGETELLLPTPSLIGDHQFVNAASAIAASLILTNNTIKAEHIAKGISTTTWPGRLQKISSFTNKEIWVDGAHNNASAYNLSLWLKENINLPIYMVIGMTQGRNVEEFVSHFKNLAHMIIGVTVENEPSSYDGSYIENIATHLGINSIGYDSLFEVEEFLANIEQPAFIIFCGSLYLVGDVINYNQRCSN